MTKFWETVVSAVIVRLICFVAAAVTLPVLTLLAIAFLTGNPQTVTSAEQVAPPYLVTVLSPFPGSPYWLTVLSASAITAFVLPRRRRKLRERRSARLDAIREASRPKVNEIEACAPIATVRRDDP